MSAFACGFCVRLRFSVIVVISVYGFHFPRRVCHGSGVRFSMKALGGVCGRRGLGFSAVGICLRVGALWCFSHCSFRCSHSAAPDWQSLWRRSALLKSSCNGKKNSNSCQWQLPPSLPRASGISAESCHPEFNLNLIYLRACAARAPKKICTHTVVTVERATNTLVLLNWKR